jgi:SH3-like domain-containing protein
MTGSIEDRDQKNHFIFGRILSPDVQAVEVLYADEQRLRWPAGGQGFLLFRQEPVEWTQLNILGEDEQVLKTYDLTQETTTLSERDESGEIDCPSAQTTLPAVEPSAIPTETPSIALFVQITVTPSETVADPITKIPEATPSLPTLTGTVMNSTAEDTFVFARSGPGTNYKRVGSIPTGQTVQIIGRTPESDWWQIRSDTLEGWVFSAYVHVEGDVLAIPCISTAEVDCAPATVPAGNDLAITAIQVFLGNPNAPLVFQREDVNPNADMRTVLIYTDAQGSEYWVDREAMRVVQWMPQPAPASEVTKSIEELHSLALTFAYHQSPKLAQNPASLTLRQMTKDGSHYAFRWEDQSITGHILPPFLQVIVRTDGEILQYMNTLDIWTK